MRIRCTELKIPSLSTPMARMFKFYFSQPGMEHVCVSVCVRMCALACLCAHLCICSLFPTIQWWSESILFLSSVTPTTVTLEACKSVYFLVQSGIDITLPFSFRVEMNVNWYKKKKNPCLLDFKFSLICQPTPVFLPGESTWTEETGGLQSIGLQRVGHDWVTKHSHIVCLHRMKSSTTAQFITAWLTHPVHRPKQELFLFYFIYLVYFMYLFYSSSMQKSCWFYISLIFEANIY